MALAHLFAKLCQELVSLCAAGPEEVEPLSEGSLALCSGLIVGGDSPGYLLAKGIQSGACKGLCGSSGSLLKRRAGYFVHEAQPRTRD
ncbi:hypothetical protein [Streptomyces jumonjinensis]|uniref:Uncharacterized protein n=1 Tax=Streptomyces jumonjinensis TaxID=1945 RepID=A0A646KMX7_STRJU|nr:hypothetical protein [Streptomyces jumonjinensis]MQT03575.1 hypothetical protein [Streptomyces jumonjinensis]